MQLKEVALILSKYGYTFKGYNWKCVAAVSKKGPHLQNNWIRPYLLYITRKCLSQLPLWKISRLCTRDVIGSFASHFLFCLHEIPNVILTWIFVFILGKSLGHVRPIRTKCIMLFSIRPTLITVRQAFEYCKKQRITTVPIYCWKFIPYVFDSLIYL